MENNYHWHLDATFRQDYSNIGAAIPAASDVFDSEGIEKGSFVKIRGKLNSSELNLSDTSTEHSTVKAEPTAASSNSDPTELPAGTAGNK